MAGPPLRTDPRAAIAVGEHHPVTATRRVIAVAASAMLNLAALLVCVLQIPLHARMPQPTDILAVEVVLTVQIAALVLLWRLMLPDASTAVAIAAQGGLFLQLATWVTRAAPSSALGPALYVMGWVVILRLLNACSHRTWGNLLPALGGFLVVWTIGGPLIGYLHREFARAPDWPVAVEGPITAGWTLAQTGSPGPAAACLIGTLCLGVGFCLASAVYARVIHRLPTPAQPDPD